MNPELELFLHQLMNGLTIGLVYALIALGYTMVYGVIGLINFAHGEVFMVGAYLALTAVWIAGAVMPGMPFWLLLPGMLVFSMLGASVLGGAIEQIAYRPL